MHFELSCPAVQDTLLFTSVHMSPPPAPRPLPSSVCLCDPSVVLFYGHSRGGKQPTCGTIIRKSESDGREGRDGGRRSRFPAEIATLPPRRGGVHFVCDINQKLALQSDLFNKWHHFSLSSTFGNAECVVTTGHKIIQRHEQVGVILAGSGQQVLFGVPAGRFRQTLTLNVWFLKSF